MTADPTRAKWDERYRDRSPSEATPCSGLFDNRHRLPDHGPALDLACGLGGNALLLARQGLEVDAWDISPVATAKLQQLADDEGLPITTRTIDITAETLPVDHYAVIAVSWYLDRELAPAIIAALQPGGLLIYQTHTQNRGGNGGPSNPDFLLEPNELPQLFAGLQVVVYREEGAMGDAGQRAWLVAQRPLEDKSHG